MDTCVPYLRHMGEGLAHRIEDVETENGAYIDGSLRRLHDGVNRVVQQGGAVLIVVDKKTALPVFVDPQQPVGVETHPEGIIEGSELPDVVVSHQMVELLIDAGELVVTA